MSVRQSLKLSPVPHRAADQSWSISSRRPHPRSDWDFENRQVSGPVGPENIPAVVNSLPGTAITVLFQFGYRYQFSPSPAFPPPPGRDTRRRQCHRRPCNRRLPPRPLPRIEKEPRQRPAGNKPIRISIKNNTRLKDCTGISPSLIMECHPRSASLSGDPSLF